MLNLEIREQQYEVGAWIALAVANSGVAVFDAYYTRRIVSVGGVEQNPLVRPFVRSKALYLVNQTAPVIADLIGLWLLKNHRGWGRSIWWLPQIGYIFVNGAVLIDNFRNDG